MQTTMPKPCVNCDPSSEVVQHLFGCVLGLKTLMRRKEIDLTSWWRYDKVLNDQLGSGMLCWRFWEMQSATHRFNLFLGPWVLVFYSQKRRSSERPRSSNTWLSCEGASPPVMLYSPGPWFLTNTLETTSFTGVTTQSWSLCNMFDLRTVLSGIPWGSPRWRELWEGRFKSVLLGVERYNHINLPFCRPEDGISRNACIKLYHTKSDA